MSRPSTPSSSVSNNNNNNIDDAVDDQMQLFMRHSSPLDGRRQSPSIISNPSPMGLSRPRSNPRNRTPMRADDEPVLGVPDNDVIPEAAEETAEAAAALTNEGQRITILPMATSSRGTNVPAALRARQEQQERQQRRQATPGQKSRKQGPSHRKVRRWNNDNFINLAQEVGSPAAAQALIDGHANASSFRSIFPTEKTSSNIMTKLAEGQSEELAYVRDKFYKGELYCHEKPSQSKKVTITNNSALTAQDQMNRIEKRLRRVVVKAIENSYPATKVMERLEHFLLSVFCFVSTGTHNNEKEEEEEETWKDLLVESPSVSRLPNGKLMASFLFDKDSSTGGFHRLLLHSLVQFHGLLGTSATTNKGRLLTATGKYHPKEGEAVHKLVDCIMQASSNKNTTPCTSSTTTSPQDLETTTNRVATLKV